MPKKQRLFKILVGGKSCHGGDFEWSLPPSLLWLPKNKKYNQTLIPHYNDKTKGKEN